MLERRLVRVEPMRLAWIEALVSGDEHSRPSSASRSSRTGRGSPRCCPARSKPARPDRRRSVGIPPVLRCADGALVGFGGFKGAPAAREPVEIGYAIAPARQGRGLATAAARVLVSRAGRPASKWWSRTRSPSPTSSTAVLTRCGFAASRPWPTPTGTSARTSGGGSSISVRRTQPLDGEGDPDVEPPRSSNSPVGGCPRRRRSGELERCPGDRLEQLDAGTHLTGSRCSQPRRGRGDGEVADDGTRRRGTSAAVRRELVAASMMSVSRVYQSVARSVSRPKLKRPRRVGVRVGAQQVGLRRRSTPQRFRR